MSRQPLFSAASGAFPKTIVGVLIGLKLVSDMLWQFALLDMLLLVLALIALAIHLPRFKVSYGLIDAVMVILLTLLTLSFARSESGFEIYIKMASAFVMYFVGREYYETFDDVVSGIKAASLVVLAACILSFVTGQGFQIWGSARTFTGPYYFKTDLACAMGVILIAALYYAKNRALQIVVSVCCLLFIVASNTRAYYVIALVILLLYLLYRVKIKVTTRLVIIAGLSLLAALFFLNWLFSTGIFGQLGFITFHFDSLSDLLNESNTQGRNVIWEVLLGRIHQQGLLGELFGVDLSSDIVVVNGSSYGSHSLYIGLLFNIGAIGLAIFLLVMIAVARAVMAMSTVDARRAYLLLSFLFQFLVSGLSVHVLQYTGNSWIPMLLFGMAVSLSRAGVPKKARMGSGLASHDLDRCPRNSKRAGKGFANYDES